MEIKNTYDIVDDRIGRIYAGRRGFYGLVSKTINVNRKCPLCGGNKEIKLNGELYTCPKCNGKSTGDMWYSYKHYSLIEYYIESITISSFTHLMTIRPVDVEQVRNDFSIAFRDINGDNHYSIGNRVSSCDLHRYILRENDIDFNKVDELENSLYCTKFVDKGTASKLQRMLNKSEKERIAEYVEEAKQLKETTSEFSHEL